MRQKENGTEIQILFVGSCMHTCVCVCGGWFGGVGLDGWVGGRGSGKICKFLSFDCAMDTCNVVRKLCIHYSITKHLRPALIHRPLPDLSVLL